MKNRLNRIMIAAPKSGSGKTIIVCALLSLLKSMGCQVLSYKCGPDYIDPMFHEQVIGVPARNLDTFFTGEKQTLEIFQNSVANTGILGISDASANSVISVIEGVMGLYDGLGGVCEEGSSYHLAKVTKTPIVLIVDAKGMGRSVIPLISGFLSYDKEQLIRAVILNKISKGYYETIKPLIEDELKISVLGYLPDNEEICIRSRHLGLVMPDEIKDIRHKLQTAAEKFAKTISVKAIIEIAENVEELEYSSKGNIKKVKDKCCIAEKNNPIIAVAKDEAFCFYYADNINLLQEKGAEIRYFSPLHDASLPQGCHALLIGGGYPELYAKKLNANFAMKSAIKWAAENQMPIVAECGGFMYLHDTLTDGSKDSYAMAGVINSECFDTGKSVRFGYIKLREKKSIFLPEGEYIKGHEFHYYDSFECGNDVIAVKPMTGKEYSCIIENENCWLGFPHLYYPSNPAFAERFVKKAGEYRDKIKE